MKKNKVFLSILILVCGLFALIGVSVSAQTGVDDDFVDSFNQQMGTNYDGIDDMLDDIDMDKTAKDLVQDIDNAMARMEAEANRTEKMSEEAKEKQVKQESEKSWKEMIDELKKKYPKTDFSEIENDISARFNISEDGKLEVLPKETELMQSRALAGERWNSWSDKSGLKGSDIWFNNTKVVKTVAVSKLGIKAGNNVFTFLQFNNQYVVCIQPPIIGVSTASNAAMWNKLTQAEKDKVRLGFVAAYTRHANTSGGYKKMLIAGQFLAWESIGAKPTVSNVGGAQQFIKDQLSTLRNDIKNWGLNPSYNGSTVTMFWNTANKRYQAVVTDSNKVSSKYTLDTALKNGINYSKSGDTITLWTNKWDKNKAADNKVNLTRKSGFKSPVSGDKHRYNAGKQATSSLRVSGYDKKSANISGVVSDTAYVGFKFTKQFNGAYNGEKAIFKLQEQYEGVYKDKITNIVVSKNTANNHAACKSVSGDNITCTFDWNTYKLHPNVNYKLIEVSVDGSFKKANDIIKLSSATPNTYVDFGTIVNSSTVTSVTPVKPTINKNVACEQDYTIVLPYTTGVTYTKQVQGNGDVKVVANAQTGYTLTGTASWTFTKAELTNNEVCSKNVIPVKPTINKNVACGVDYKIVLATTTGVTYTSTKQSNGDYYVVASAKEGYKLVGTTSWLFKESELKNTEVCSDDKMKVSFYKIDRSGKGLAGAEFEISYQRISSEGNLVTLKLKKTTSDSSGFILSLIEMVVGTAADTVLPKFNISETKAPNGYQSIESFDVNIWDNVVSDKYKLENCQKGSKDCKVYIYNDSTTGIKSATPVKPTIDKNVACDEDYKVVPAVTTGVKYNIEYLSNGDVKVVATPEFGYKLVGASTNVWTFTKSELTNNEVCDVSVTPVVPTIDKSVECDEDYKIKIPTTTGVIYNVENQSNGNVKIDAIALKGYVIKGTSTWTFTKAELTNIEICPYNFELDLTKLDLDTKELLTGMEFVAETQTSNSQGTTMIPMNENRGFVINYKEQQPAIYNTWRVYDADLKVTLKEKKAPEGYSNDNSGGFSFVVKNLGSRDASLKPTIQFVDNKNKYMEVSAEFEKGKCALDDSEYCYHLGVTAYDKKIPEPVDLSNKKVGFEFDLTKVDKDKKIIDMCELGGSFEVTYEAEYSIATHSTSSSGGQPSRFIKEGKIDNICNEANKSSNVSVDMPLVEKGKDEKTNREDFGTIDKFSFTGVYETTTPKGYIKMDPNKNLLQGSINVKLAMSAVSIDDYNYNLLKNKYTEEGSGNYVVSDAYFEGYYYDGWNNVVEYGVKNIHTMKDDSTYRERDTNWIKVLDGKYKEGMTSNYDEGNDNYIGKGYFKYVGTQNNFIDGNLFITNEIDPGPKEADFVNPSLDTNVQCEENFKIDMPENTKEVTYELKDLGDNKVIVIAKPNEGYKFEDDKEFITWTFDLTHDEPCPTYIEALEPSVAKSDDCEGEMKLDIPEQEHVSYNVESKEIELFDEFGNQTGIKTVIEVNAVPDYGYQFKEGTIFTWEFENVSEKCPIDVEPIEPTIDKGVECEKDYELNIPEDTGSIKYEVKKENGKTIIKAVAQDGFKFKSDVKKQWEFSDEDLKNNEKCPVEIKAVKPVVKTDVECDEDYTLDTSNIDTTKMDVKVINEDKKATVVVTPKEGYIFEEEDTAVLNGVAIYEFDLTNDELCIVVPSKPEINKEVECEKDFEWLVPGFNGVAEIKGLVYELLANGNVRVSPAEGYKFAGEEQFIIFDDDLHNDELCPIEVTPVAPTLNKEVECEEDYIVNVPTMDNVTYTRTQDKDIVTIKASVEKPYVFKEGAKTEWTFNIHNDELCPIEVTPIEPTINKQVECEKDYIVNVPTMDNVTYTKTQDGKIVTIKASVEKPYVFSKDAKTEWIFDVSNDELCPIEVTPLEPTINKEVECEEDYIVNVPEVDNITYTKEQDGKIVTIKASVEKPYVFKDGVTTKWSFDVTNDELCPIEVDVVEPTLNKEVECEQDYIVNVPEVANIKYTKEQEGKIVTITASVEKPYVFAKDAKTKWIFDITNDELCSIEVEPIAPELEANPDCDNEPTLKINPVVGIDYDVKKENNKYIVDAKIVGKPYVMKENVITHWEFDIVVEKCDILITPIVPTIDKDVECEKDYDLIVPGYKNTPKQTGLEYEVIIKDKVATIVVKTTKGYTFEDGVKTKWEFDLTNDEKCPIEVEPKEPTVDPDVECEEDYKVVVPENDCLEYDVKIENGKAKVIAKAKVGCKISENAKTEWELDLANSKSCEVESIPDMNKEKPEQPNMNKEKPIFNLPQTGSEWLMLGGLLSGLTGLVFVLYKRLRRN